MIVEPELPIPEGAYVSTSRAATDAQGVSPRRRIRFQGGEETKRILLLRHESLPGETARRCYSIEVVDEELLEAGYVLVMPADAPLGLESVPRRLFTISDCIMADLPRPDFWDWFEDLGEARATREVSSPESQVISVSLRSTDAQAFMVELGGSEQPYFSLLRRNRPFKGELLGYEVVGAEQTLDFHSWHCHGYADDVRLALGIKVNDLGLLSTFADAHAVLEWMLSRPDDDAPEPVPWVVVALGRPA